MCVLQVAPWTAQSLRGRQMATVKETASLRMAAMGLKKRNQFLQKAWDVQKDKSVFIHSSAHQWPARIASVEWSAMKWKHRDENTINIMLIQANSNKEVNSGESPQNKLRMWSLRNVEALMARRLIILKDPSETFRKWLGPCSYLEGMATSAAKHTWHWMWLTSIMLIDQETFL